MIMNLRNAKFVIPGATLILAVACVLGVRGVPPAQAQTPSNHNATRADFDQMMTELSNWNRWGKDDQMGAVNLITPAKRKQALGLVKDGACFSMARNAEMEKAVDNPVPVIRKVLRLGADAPATGSGGTADSFFIAYHGY